MSTNLLNQLEEFEKRWDELVTLSRIVHDHFAVEESPEYKALCRSITVLTCSHLEGALKAASRAFVCDINDFSIFSRAPAPLRRSYIENVLLASNKQSDQNAVTRLDEALCGTDFKMDEGALFVKNKNPNVHVVSQHYELFKGRKESIFKILAKSRLSVVFEGDSSKTRRLLRDVKQSCRNGASTYPYQMTKHYFKPNENSSTSADMFEPFLEDLLRRRHDIVHGNTLANGLSIVAIDDYIMKAQMLLYGYVLAVCQDWSA